MNNDDSPFASRREPAIAASPIDQAIDRAVRKMMQVDPPAGLRRRVMSRIEPLPSTRRFMGSLGTRPFDSRPPRRSIFVPAFAAAAALTILVLGVMVTRDSRVVPPPAGAPAAVVVETATPADTRVARTVPEAAPPRRPQRVLVPKPGGFRREPIPMAPVADIFGAPASSIAAASDPTADAVWTAPTASDVDDTVTAPPPLVVRPMSVPPIDTPAIVIAPLVVGPTPSAPPGPPR